MKKIRWGISLELVLLAAAVCMIIVKDIRLGSNEKTLPVQEEMSGGREAVEVSADGSYIKWVDFNVTCEAMGKAYELDVATYKEDIHLNWIELLAYVGTLSGGKFDKKKCF